MPDMSFPAVSHLHHRHRHRQNHSHSTRVGVRVLIRAKLGKQLSWAGFGGAVRGLALLCCQPHNYSLGISLDLPDSLVLHVQIFSVSAEKKKTSARTHSLP